MHVERAQWPRPARELAAAVEQGLAAATAGERAAFDEALGRLVRAEREPLATLLGQAVLDLLERIHPDGLDADGAEHLLDAAATAAGPWFPRLDDDLLLRALAGALSLGELGDAPRLDADAVLAHGLLLLAELLRTARLPARTVVDAAMAELVRAQTVEMP